MEDVTLRGGCKKYVYRTRSEYRNTKPSIIFQNHVSPPVFRRGPHCMYMTQLNADLNCEGKLATTINLHGKKKRENLFKTGNWFFQSK
jgi:hypothetical protein